VKRHCGTLAVVTLEDGLGRPIPERIHNASVPVVMWAIFKEYGKCTETFGML
jgi:hypothetical protein